MIDLVRAGRSPDELAREFEPTAQSIRNWVAQAERDAGGGDGGLTTAEREELNRLRRENRQLRLERGVAGRRSAQEGCQARFSLTGKLPDAQLAREWRMQ